MNAEQRRAAVSEYLHSQAGPVSAAALAARFSVSRQIIVGDVALLRAGGVAVMATPRGYILENAASAPAYRKILCPSLGEPSFARSVFVLY